MFVGKTLEWEKQQEKRRSCQLEGSGGSDSSSADFSCCGSCDSSCRGPSSSLQQQLGWSAMLFVEPLLLLLSRGMSTSLGPSNARQCSGKRVHTLTVQSMTENDDNSGMRAGLELKTTQPCHAHHHQRESIVKILFLQWLDFRRPIWADECANSVSTSQVPQPT